jgi:hypothetical protein
MDKREALEELSKEIQDALIFNTPILPCLVKAWEKAIRITFIPMSPQGYSTIRMRLEAETGSKTILYVDTLIDSEVLYSSIFYNTKDNKKE